MKDYIFGVNTSIYADTRLCAETLKSLWKGFTFGCGTLTVEKGSDCVIRIGNAPVPALAENSEYAVHCDENGVSVAGRDEKCLMRGFSALLMHIDYVDLEKDVVLKIPALDIQGIYPVRERMLHLCVFPETEYYFLIKMIRLAGVLQYTHVVVEYWGTFPFECLPELGWKEKSYTKEQTRKIAEEIRRFGMEPVPMFNHLGHAPGARGGAGGKHTILDQNPRLQYLFTHDGWSYDIRKESVIKLQAEIRRELYETFGKGEYIHIGCDEAPTYFKDKEMRALLPEHLNKLTSDIAAEGRRPLIWMDMFLPKELNKTVGPYGGTQEEAKQFISSLHPCTVGVDWEYETENTVPMPSTRFFKENGANVIGASWYKDGNIKSHIETAKQLGLSGVMLTTWHTLSTRARSILVFAVSFDAVVFPWTNVSEYAEETATLLRKISFEGNDYSSAGWKQEQIEV